MSIKETQLGLMQRKLAQHSKHEQRGLLLLKLGFLLTFLLYLLFNQHLYLGDALSWSAYFNDAASLFGFVFTVVIVVLMALFLSWVKHHAYLHFGFFGSVALVITTVIGFALFAEFFSSSANQDVKASVLLERNSAYQATLNPNTTRTSLDNGLALSIAHAEQKLARCEENLKAGKEKHCNGDKAKVEALRSSETAVKKANAEADIQRTKLNYERQDELKAESYNPVILTLARVLAGEHEDYKDYLKTAVVIITLFVAICFEILHHFLSKTHGASMQAIEGLELSIAKYSAQPEPVMQFSSTSSKPFEPEQVKQPMGFGFPSPRPAPSTAQLDSKPTLFKYQVQAKEINEINETKARRPIGFSFPTSASGAQTVSKLGTQEEPLPLPDFGSFKARRDVFASPALSDSETSLTTPTDIAANVRVHPEPTDIAANVRVHTPLDVRAHPNKEADQAFLEALKDAQGKIDTDMLKEVFSVYEFWKAALLNQEPVLSARGGRDFINRQLCQARKKTITPAGMDALLVVWRKRAAREGLLTPNPRYTGKPPHPEYLLATRS